MTKWPSQKKIDEMTKKHNVGLASRPLAKDANQVDRLKYQICEQFVIYKNNNKITQKALSKTLDIDEALMSKILHYHFDEFTIDRLVKFLSILYPRVDVTLVPKKKKTASGF